MSKLYTSGRAELEFRRVEILSEGEFKLFRDLIHEECGFNCGAEKRAFLESRLRRRMDDLGIKSAQEYYSFLKDSANRGVELPSLLDALMICETSFFRNQPQFDLLRDAVVPEIVARKERAGLYQVRVWSAGCSTGQEPYTVAMLLLEGLPCGEKWSLKVFASDLSFTALERAQSGIYRPDQLKVVEPRYVQKYFRQENGHYFVREELKRHIVFDYHNLKHDNGLRGMDIILCRNVMIYFDAQEQRRLIDRFTGSLLPGGFLLLGHAESLQGLSSRFAMVHRNKGIAYRFNG